MKLRTLTLLSLALCLPRPLPATTCIVPPPCGRIHQDAILFVGTVLDSGTPEGKNRVVRVKVDEAFIGVPAGTKEVTVVSEGDWLIRGRGYLMDIYRGEDGRYYPAMCGATEEIPLRYNPELLDYLRLYAKGQAKTSLTVSVRDENRPLAGARVTVTGPEGTLKDITGPEGFAKFENVAPGKYTVAATRVHYKATEEGSFNLEPNVVPGSCPTSSIALQSEASVSGRVRDAQGSPASSLEMELVAVPESDDGSLFHTPFFMAKTAADGSFVFEGVSPGRYLLGSNIIGLQSSAVPPTYYPGRPERNGAIAIEVEPGESVGGLAMNLPDFGSQRDIRICVVDDNGSPVPGARVKSPIGGPQSSAGLGEDLVTNETGCVSARGYAGASYAVMASITPADGNLRQMRFSGTVVIAPGEKPTVQVLKLGKPLGFAPAK